uniref:6-cysteine protein n=1 Tax=Parastrongyloides trichosuri TaxID=131310 RepID=A0A0N4ZXT7_PARTI
MFLFYTFYIVLFFADLRRISVSTVKFNYEIYNTDIFGKRISSFKKVVKLKDLPDIERPVGMPSNIKSNRPVKLFQLDHHKLISSNNSCGTILNVIEIPGYYVTMNVAYNEGHQFMDLNTYRAFFNIHQCDFGLMIIDSKIKTDTINNNVEEIYTVDYIIIFVLKTAKNIMIWNTFEYNGVNVFVSVCPYIRWAPRNEIIKLIPEPYIKDNGFTTPLNNEAHIIVPIYPRKNDLNFFICAKVKQPSLPDLSLGYSIMPGGIEMSYEEDVNGLFNELTCKNKQDPSKLYHFGHISRYSNYLEKDIWEKITANSLKEYNLYLDEIILMYDKNIIDDRVESNDTIIKLKDRNIKEKPVCIRKVAGNVEAKLIPIIESSERILYDEASKTNYILVQDKEINRKISIKCISMVKKDTFKRYEQFYSKSAFIYVVKDDGEKNEVKEVLFNNHYEGFGSYTCHISKMTLTFKKELVSIGKTYFIPSDKCIFKFDDFLYNKIEENYIFCNQFYDDWGKLESMNITSEFLDEKNIFISNLTKSNENLSFKNKKIYLKSTSVLNVSKVICKYKTIVGTSFTSEQIIKVPETIINIIDVSTIQPKLDSEKNFVVVITGIVLIFLILGGTLIATVIILLKKKKKRKKRRMRRDVLYNKPLSKFSDSKSQSTIKNKKSTLPSISSFK